MRILLFVAVSLSMFAQNQPQPINKDSLQGYSKDVLDQKEPKTTLSHPQQTFKSNEASKPVQVPEDLQTVVAKQYGPQCTVALERSTMHMNYAKPVKEIWTPFLETDIDGDGVPDAIIAAHCEKIVTQANNFGFRLSDPYMTYHGYGDPKITSEFGSVDPAGGVMVLVLLGAGSDGWRAAQPKAKWALINLPFDNLSLTRVPNKKRALAALLLESRDEQDSVAYWDGKKWQWRDLASNK